MKKITLIAISLIFLGCNSDNKNKTHEIENPLKKEYYKTGELKTEGEFYNDSLKNGWFKMYFKNGIIAHESNWKQGKQIGEEKTYYENGQIKRYRLYDHLSQLRLIMKYDSLGNFEEKQGRLLASTFLNFDYDSVKVARDVIFDFIIASPPNCSTKVIVLVNELNTTKKRENNNEVFIPVSKTFAKYTTIFKELGKYQIITKVQITDTIKKQKLIDIDTTFINVVN